MALASISKRSWGAVQDVWNEWEDVNAGEKGMDRNSDIVGWKVEGNAGITGMNHDAKEVSRGGSDTKEKVMNKVDKNGW